MHLGAVVSWQYIEIRQGCPLSAYLFILVVEILAIMIRSNRLIKGIKLKNKEIKISQLADDTTIILDDIRSVPEVKKELLIFFKCSGLKTNIDKTQAFMIQHNIVSLKTTYGLKWNTGSINLLGVHITDSMSDNYKYNFEPKLKKKNLY